MRILSQKRRHLRKSRKNRKTKGNTLTIRILTITDNNALVVRVASVANANLAVKGVKKADADVDADADVEAVEAVELNANSTAMFRAPVEEIHKNVKVLGSTTGVLRVTTDVVVDAISKTVKKRLPRPKSLLRKSLLKK
jgi:hypothetical protein